ncbi:hypothetical protein Dimus_038906 [Dionaea muscipula]
MCRCFLFRANVKNPAASWAAVCSSRWEGGLGLFHLHIWNQALIFSNLWNIHLDKESQWIQWIYHYYLRGTSVWSWQLRNDASVFMKHMIRNELLNSFGSVTPQLQAYFSRPRGAAKSITAMVYDQLRIKRQPKFWTTVVWHSHIDLKLSFIFWKASFNRLRTRNNFRGAINDTTCLLCHVDDEFAPHLFFTCAVTGPIWAALRDWLHLPCPSNCLLRLTCWTKHHTRGNGTKAAAIRITLAAAVYYIWRA